MRTPTKQGIQVLRRANEFLRGIEITTGLGSYKKQVETLGQTVDRIATHAVEQESSDRGFRASASTAQALAKSLRGEFMLPISRTGKLLFPADAALKQSLAMPRRKDYEGLIAAAYAMADRAEEHKDRFVGAGFSDDFAERLRQATADLRKALDDKAVHYGNRAAATAGLVGEMSHGRGLVRILEAMVAPRLVDTPDKLAQWRTLSRFLRTVKLPDEGATPPTGIVVPNGTPVTLAVSAGATTTGPALHGQGEVLDRAA